LKTDHAVEENIEVARGRLLAKKSVAQIQQEFTDSDLKRTLGPFNLISLGIGAIIGAGIFVMTGNAAANFAGPAVVLSFIIAGLACTFADCVTPNSPPPCRCPAPPTHTHTSRSAKCLRG
jgi:amino acid permease